jgi:hypothetical protein
LFFSIKHIEGKNGAAEALNWRTRVQIVLEAAQGMLQ